jgi:predicted nucleic acid-binding protein
MAVICCDTSFLFSLYGRDSLTGTAVSEAGHLKDAISISVLNELEWENAIRLSLFRNTLDSILANGMLADYVADLNLGKLSQAACDLSAVIAGAKRISLAYSQHGGHRTFDILHVAAALHLGARDFLSFDANQRKLAKAEGLKIRPA